MQLKKSLGQNFFNNPTLADKIVSYVANDNPSQILEIGPGDGYFTQRLLNITENLIAIEKDSEVAQFLGVKFPQISVVNKDFLDINLSELPIEKDCIVYGSLPYNVSKKIIQICVEANLFKSMYFIIQKEVAEKYTDRDDKTSLLSIMTSLYAQVKYIMTIKPGAFIPQPKVDSALVQIIPRESYKSIENIKSFKELVTKAFANPRKTLRNNLKQYSNLDLGKYENKRAQDLTLADFMYIYDSMK